MTIDRQTTVLAFALGALLGTTAALLIQRPDTRATGKERLGEIELEIDLLKKESIQIVIADLESNQEAERAECYSETVRHGVNITRGLVDASDTTTVCEEILRLIRPEARCDTRLNMIGDTVLGVWKLEGPSGDWAWLPEKLERHFSVMADDAAEAFSPGTRHVRFRLNDLLNRIGVCD